MNKFHECILPLPYLIIHEILMSQLPEWIDSYFFKDNHHKHLVILPLISSLPNFIESNYVLFVIVCFSCFKQTLPNRNQPNVNTYLLFLILMGKQLVDTRVRLVMSRYIVSDNHWNGRILQVVLKLPRIGTVALL